MLTFWYSCQCRGDWWCQTLLIVSIYKSLSLQNCRFCMNFIIVIEQLWQDNLWGVCLLRIYWEFCEGNSWCLLSLIGLTAEHWVWRGKRSCRRESGGRHGGCWAGGWRWSSFHPRTVSWQGNWGLHKLVSGERLPETGEVFEEESSDLRPRQGDEVHLRQGAQWRPGGREGVRV